ncbi:GerAB/ArcD/ProY family transporter [Paenibacillus sp. UMB7766-LJ446]|nr:GerAB/ArcD/ProY family transporter [Paenibacillus sp. UMB7766-LJ446]MDK8194810.1 GerAB/ArcD/ProY family transporter [Paenibacillus sp. UMB7766-LJ446]
MLIYPSVITSYAKQDSWICALIGVPLGMLLMLMYLKLCSLYPEKNLIQILRSILGFWPGSLISVFYLFFFCHRGFNPYQRSRRLHHVSNFSIYSDSSHHSDVCHHLGLGPVSWLRNNRTQQ